MAAVKSKKPTKTPSKKLKAGKKKPLNKWLILGGVVAVAVIGVLVVRFSSASSYTFVRKPNQMNGGKQISNYRYISGAKPYWNDYLAVATIVSSQEIAKSTKICTYFGSNTRPVQVGVGDDNSRNMRIFKQYPSGTSNVCILTKDIRNDSYYGSIARKKGLVIYAKLNVPDGKTWSVYSNTPLIYTIYGK